MKNKRQRKRANAILSAIAVTAVASAAVLILTSLNTTIAFKEDIKELTAEKYNREAYVSLLLDSAVESMLDAKVNVTDISTYGECAILLEELKRDYEADTSFSFADAETLPGDIGLDQTCVSILQKSLGKNPNPIGSCSLAYDLYISSTSLGLDTELSTYNEIPLAPFQITVSLDTRTATSERTWEVEGAVLIVKENYDGYDGSLSFSTAKFSIIESNI